MGFLREIQGVSASWRLFTQGATRVCLAGVPFEQRQVVVVVVVVAAAAATSPVLKVFRSENVCVQASVVAPPSFTSLSSPPLPSARLHSLSISTTPFTPLQHSLAPSTLPLCSVTFLCPLKHFLAFSSTPPFVPHDPFLVLPVLHYPPDALHTHRPALPSLRTSQSAVHHSLARGV